MTKENESAIPWIIKRWKERKILKKKVKIEELKLDIETARLEKKLREANENG